MFKKIKNKKAIGSIETSIKVITVIVLGALLIFGSYGMIKGIVLPSTERKINDMFDKRFSESGGSFSRGASIDELKAMYNFEYYSTIEGAVNDVNASTPGENADCDELLAEAGLYEKDDGTACVVLLKDADKNSTLTLSNNIELNLGGHVLSFSGVTDGLSSTSGSYNILINGNLSGSAINVTAGTGAVRTIRAQYNNWTISGGTYTATGSKAVYNVVTAVKCVLINCNFVADGDSADKTICGINIANGSYDVDISNCNFIAKSSGKKSIALSNGSGYTGTITAKNSSFNAYSNYKYSEGYVNSSQGIDVYGGTLRLNDCSVYGTHSGIQVTATNLYINGGIYSGCGHGGLYYGHNCAGKSCYLVGATFKESGILGGYSDLGGDINHAAMYIGMGSNNNIYVDNCKFKANNNDSSYGRTIVLRNTAGETNNKLYISNSALDKRTVRVDAGNKVYIGVGNNFTSSDITASGTDYFENTSERYCQ